MGRPFAPILLNVLITSVCDMRCVHCFFTDELDDKARKKLQMTTRERRAHQRNAGRQSRRPDHCGRRAVYPQGSSGNREGFLQEQQARRHRPDVEWTDPAAHHSRRHAHSRRMSESECHRGAGHRRIEGRSRKHPPETRKLGHCHRHRAQAAGDQEGISAARYPDLHLLHEQQPGSYLRVVRLPEIRSEAGQGEHQFHSSAVGAAEGTHHRQVALRQARRI